MENKLGELTFLRTARAELHEEKDLRHIDLTRVTDAGEDSAVKHRSEQRDKESTDIRCDLRGIQGKSVYEDRASTVLAARKTDANTAIY